MAEETINQQTEDTSPTSDDLVPVWDVTTAVQKKVTLANIKSSIMQYNPYKFRVYRTAAWTSSNGSLGVVPFDTKTGTGGWDTNSNVDITTNKGRYTSPVAGFFQINGAAQSNLNNGGYGLVAILVNGVEVSRGNQVNGKDGSTLGNTVSDVVHVAANDYIEIAYQGVGNAGTAGSTYTYFSGFLVSLT